MTMIKITSLALAAALLASCNIMDPMTVNDPTVVDASFQRPGFVARERDGRLTVFRAEDPELAAFRRSGDLVQSVTRINGGPAGRTVRAPDAATIEAYALARPGFVTRVVDGRIWVFAAGSPEFEVFCQHGEPAQSITRIGAGPNGETIRGPSAEVIDAWLAEL